MSTVGKTIVIRGELRAGEDVLIEGRIEGPVLCEGCSVVVASSGTLMGPVIARDITVFGCAAGQLIATDIVDLRAGAHVTGDIVAPRFILDESAGFAGRVEPQHLEAALRVARFEQKKRDAALAG